MYKVKYVGICTPEFKASLVKSGQYLYSVERLLFVNR